MYSKTTAAEFWKEAFRIRVAVTFIVSGYSMCQPDHLQVTCHLLWCFYQSRN